MQLQRWQVSVGATLDRVLADGDARTIGRVVATTTSTRLVMTAGQGDRLTVTVSPGVVELPDVEKVRAAYAATVEAVGYTVVGWEQLEALSSGEVDRRLETVGMPALINAADFAELLGISTQRIYELTHESSEAVKAGREHPFPAPLVPGWWLRPAAERYAAHGRRRGGRPRKAAGGAPSSSMR